MVSESVCISEHAPESSVSIMDRVSVEPSEFLRWKREGIYFSQFILFKSINLKLRKRKKKAVFIAVFETVG